MEKAINKIRIIIADDHEVLRDGLKGLLGKHEDLEVVGTAGNGREAIAQCQELQPDVVVMDIGMPELNGVDATRQIKARFPVVKVVCLSMHKENAVIGAMLQAGASGYLVKNCAGRELVTAIRTVMRGETYISPGVAGDVINTYVREKGGKSESFGAMFADLTERERQVLQLIAEGRNTKEVATNLDISDKTVAAHRLKLMEKLNCQSVADLTRYAVRQGLVEP